MIVPFKILVAALSTLIVLLGKLAEDMGHMPKKPLPSVWGIVMTALIGVAVFFWCISLTEKVTPITAILGIILCNLAVVYRVGGMEFNKKGDKVSTPIPDLESFVGRKGKIAGKINDGEGKSYIGTLIEGGEDVIIQFDEEVVKEGDEFTITYVDSDGMHGEII